MHKLKIMYKLVQYCLYYKLFFVTNLIFYLMEKQISLQNLEKQTSSLIFTTGVVDIEISLILMVSSLAMLFDDYRYYIYFLYLVPFIFIFLALKYIVRPRMGNVNYSRKRVKRSRTFSIITTIILVSLVLLTAFGEKDYLSEFINPRYIVAGIIFAICAAIAFFLNFARMYFYAVLITATFLTIEFLHYSNTNFKSGYVYLIAATIILIIGCVYLNRFLKQYPLPKMNQHD